MDWRCTCDARILEGARSRAMFAEKHSAIQWVWNNTRRSTRTKEHSSVNSATRRLNDHRRFLPICLFIRIRDLSPAITAERDFTKNRTWKNTHTFTRGRSPTSVCSAGRRSVNQVTLSHTVENILASNRFRAKFVIGRSIERSTSGVTRTRTKWTRWLSRTLSTEQTYIFSSRSLPVNISDIIPSPINFNFETKLKRKKGNSKHFFKRFQITECMLPTYQKLEHLPVEAKLINNVKLVSNKKNCWKISLS